MPETARVGATNWAVTSIGAAQHPLSNSDETGD